MMCYGRRKISKAILFFILINVGIVYYVFMNVASLEQSLRSRADVYYDDVNIDTFQKGSKPSRPRPNKLPNFANSNDSKGLNINDVKRNENVNEIQLVVPPLKKTKNRHGLEPVHSLKPWQQFQAGLTKNHMYVANAPYMQDLLDSLSRDEIRETKMFKGGSQVKLFFEFSNGNTALVKPRRMKIDEIYGYTDEHPFWLDPERHNAEIASFHLDRILGMRRSVPVAGRLINMTKEIIEKSNDKELLDTFFRKDGNLCFIGVCAPWFCNKDHPICGVGDIIEVSMAQFLPKFSGHTYSLSDKAYPWSQGIKESKVWKGANICDEVYKKLNNGKERTFLDLIDLAIFDFLIVNYDRHHYTTLSKFEHDGFVAFVDNGKGFGNYKKDDETFLAPVYQCCKIHQSTYNRLKKLSQDDEKHKLSTLMRTSLSHDPLSPVVNDKFLKALDRRLQKAIKTIETCFTEHGRENVLVQ